MLRKSLLIMVVFAMACACASAAQKDKKSEIYLQKQVMRTLEMYLEIGRILTTETTDYIATGAGDLADEAGDLREVAMLKQDDRLGLFAMGLEEAAEYLERTEDKNDIAGARKAYRAASPAMILIVEYYLADKQKDILNVFADDKHNAIWLQVGGKVVKNPYFGQEDLHYGREIERDEVKDVALAEFKKLRKSKK